MVNGEDALPHLTQWGQGAGGGHATARPLEDQGPLAHCRASLLEKGWGRVWAPTCETDNRRQPGPEVMGSIETGSMETHCRLRYSGQLQGTEYLVNGRTRGWVRGSPVLH